MSSRRMKSAGGFDIILIMDVYLGAEAEAELRAEALIKPSAGRRGVLLGHRRGPRYIVSRIFPLGGRAFPEAARLRELDRLFGGRIIGYYAARRPASGSGSLLGPAACGKIFIRVRGTDGRSRKLDLKPGVIDYDGRFRLAPISLAGERK